MEEFFVNAVYIACFFMGAIARGLVSGMFPAALALKRGSMKYVKRSLLVCVAVSILLSIEFSIIISCIMIIVVLKKVPPPSRKLSEEE